MTSVELALLRYYGTKGYTAGKLYINGDWHCNTLEDEVREPGVATKEKKPVSEWKKAATTAIPRGRYEIVLRYSPRFKRETAYLLDVEGFSYILVHAGNKAEHTEGCILVGRPDGNDRDAWLGNSRVAEDAFTAYIRGEKNKGNRVFITVV
jgi:hypothetical protein